MRRNSQDNHSRNIKIAEECSSKLTKSMNYRCYSTKNMTMFSEDLSRFLGEYKSRSMGENSGETLRHWMGDFDHAIDKYFMDVISNDLSKSVAQSDNHSR